MDERNETKSETVADFLCEERLEGELRRGHRVHKQQKLDTSSRGKTHTHITTHTHMHTTL